MTQQFSKYEAEQILGLTGSYSKQSLRKTYLRMMREWHPDVATAHGHDPIEAEAKTKKINEAFEVLNDSFPANASTVQCDSAPAPGSSKEPPSPGKRAYAKYAAEREAEAAEEEARNPWSVHTDPSHAAEPPKPRNVSAARIYTGIITSPTFRKLFVLGMGPHLVWVASLLAFTVVTALLTGGLAIAFGELILVFGIGADILFGFGAECVTSFADVWAVNKAVKQAGK